MGRKSIREPYLGDLHELKVAKCTRAQWRKRRRTAKIETRIIATGH